MSVAEWQEYYHPFKESIFLTMVMFIVRYKYKWTKSWKSLKPDNNEGTKKIRFDVLFILWSIFIIYLILKKKHYKTAIICIIIITYFIYHLVGLYFSPYTIFIIIFDSLVFLPISFFIARESFHYAIGTDVRFFDAGIAPDV